ncbi:PEP-CTERM sorting domain-containing protein [Tunturiibacter psychrotolerans]|uniref:PEP-CTERM sorting domain-containing protein n=1 Tax=Tunturiibacter psychrotolerans TaxID=3069686 RepID=UPI003D22DAE3
MRPSSRFLLPSTLVLFLVLASTPLALADTVSLSITELASGTLGSQSFTSRDVTFTGTFSSNQLLNCSIENDCERHGIGYYILFDATYPGVTTTLVTTITVGGLGTYAANSGNNVIEFYYGGGSLTSIVPYEGIDTVGRLYFPTNPLDVTDCEGDFPSFYCPLSAYTSAGSLILTSVSDTYTTSTVVTGNSTVPEPSTLALLATGVAALSELSRRRLRSA